MSNVSPSCSFSQAGRMPVAERSLSMTRVVIALAVALAAAGASLSAHHSYSAYHTDRLVEIEGIIDEFEWRAPHSLLKVKTDDGSLHIFEWQAPRSLQRRGVQQDTLKEGDRVIVSG